MPFTIYERIDMANYSISTIKIGSNSYSLSDATARANFANYLPLSGGTISGNVTFSNYVGTALTGYTPRGLYGTIADNDYWRVVGYGSSNSGALEIATADDGNEPIYVRQYSGVFSTVVRTATLLDGSGNTSFPNQVSQVKSAFRNSSGTVKVYQCYNSDTDSLDTVFS